MTKEIRIGKKSKGAYVSAVLYAFNNGQNSVVVAGLGGQVSKTVDVADKVENMMDVVQMGNEQFLKDQLLGVRITLEKKKKEGSK